MVRIGKFDEEKVLFKDSGHRHTGGTGGAHIQADGLATGCIVKYPTSGAKESLAYGATTFGDASGDINIDTGLTSVTQAWLEVIGATAGYVSATSGATITAHPTATAGSFWWFSLGYA